MCLFPDFDRGKGPIRSIPTLSKGSLDLMLFNIPARLSVERFLVWQSVQERT